MSRKCALTGKRPRSANNVSHSQKKVKRVQYPNIQKRKIYVPEVDRWVTIKVSAKAIRTIDKKGLMNWLDEKGMKLKDVIA